MPTRSSAKAGNVIVDPTSIVRPAVAALTNIPLFIEFLLRSVVKHDVVAMACNLPAHKKSLQKQAAIGLLVG
jgi:hypothetical protein